MDDQHRPQYTQQQQASRAQVLFGTLKTYNMAPPGRPGQESADAVAALKSLGYISGTAASPAFTDRKYIRAAFRVIAIARMKPRKAP